MALYLASGQLGILLLMFLFPAPGYLFINFKPGFEYEYKIESTSTVKNLGDFLLRAKVGYINVEERNGEQEVLVRIRTFSFSQVSTPHTVGHGIDFNKWFSFFISRHGEIRSVLYDQREDDEILNIKKGIAAMFAGKLHNQDEISTRKALGGWKYDVEDLGHEGPHNASYRVESRADGKKFTKTRSQHPLVHAKSNYTKTLYYNSNLGTIHTVHVEEKVSIMGHTPAGYDPFEGHRPVNPVNKFSDIEYPEMAALGNGKLEFVTQHKLKLTPKRTIKPVVKDSIHITKIKRKPTKSQEPQKILEQIRGNLTIMRNIPDNKPNQEVTHCFRFLTICLELLDDIWFKNITEYYLSLDTLSIRNERDQSHIVDAMMATKSDRAQNIVTEKILNTDKPNVKLIMSLMMSIIAMDTAPNKVLLARLFELGFEKHKSEPCLRKGDVYHGILLTIGSVSRKLHKSGRSQEAADAISKIEKMIGYHDPYLFRKKRSVMTEMEIEEEDTLKVNLLGALGNARLDQSYEYIVSHINTTNCQWVKRAGIIALRGYPHDHAAKLMLTTARYDEHDTVRYEAMIQYQSHPKAKILTPYTPPVAQNSSYNGSSIYFNPWDLDANDANLHPRNKRGFFDEGFEFLLASPSVDRTKVLGNEKLGASFGIVIKNLLDLKIAPLSGHVEVDVHDEAFALIHLGIINRNIEFFVARVCFKGGARYNLNILQEFGVNSLDDLVKLWDNMKNNVVGALKTGLDLFSKIIRGEISVHGIINNFINALKQLPQKVMNLGRKAAELMKKLGEIDETDLPPFIKSISKLVNIVVGTYNDIKKDVMGFFNSLLEPVTVLLPRAWKLIQEAIEAIFKAFKDFFSNPKKAITTIGSNVIKIRLEVKNLQYSVNKTVQLLSFKKGNRPAFLNLGEMFANLKEAVKEVKDTLNIGSTSWLKQGVKKGRDPVEEFTKGKFSINELRKDVIGELKELVEDLLFPFGSVNNLGGDLTKTFNLVSSTVTAVRKAYDALKTGYRIARSLIDRIFGPKCHKDFPRKFRSKVGGCGSGDYPSSTTAGQEYDVDGVDLEIENGKELVAPFSGNIRRSARNNREVLLMATGGSLKDTEIIITNIEPSSFVPPYDDDFLQPVNAGQVIGKVASSACGVNHHIHFAMRRIGLLESGVIDPTRYLEPRLPQLPKWIQECDDKRLVWNDDVIADGPLVGIGGRKEIDTSPERTGDIDEPTLETSSQSNLAEDEDQSLFDNDSFFGKAKSNKPAVEKKLESTKDPALKSLFKRPFEFIKKFSIRKLKVGSILDLLEILKLEDSQKSMTQVILKIKDIIEDKPCFNPYQMNDDQLRIELTERGLDSGGSRKTMIETLTTPAKECPGLTINMLNDKMFCTSDPHCLGIECCVHLKVFMFRKAYKIYARYEPCENQFVFGIKGKTEEFVIGPFEDIYDSLEKNVKTGIKMDLLGGLEVIFRLRIEKTESVVLGTLGIGICMEDDEENCLPFIYLLNEAIFPVPTCAPDGSYIFPEVDWEGYLNRDNLKRRFQVSAKKYAEELLEFSLKEGLKQLGFPEHLLEETVPCQRPEVLSDEILKSNLAGRGLSTSGTSDQLIERLTDAHRTCEIFGHKITVPTIKNEKLKKVLYLEISNDCLRLQACIDIQIKSITPTINFARSFLAYVELDSCNFQFHIGFENYRYTEILIGYKWGTEEELKITENIVFSYKINRDDSKKVFVIDLSGIIKALGTELINGKIIDGMELPIPVCNENFTLPGGGSMKDLSLALNGKLSDTVVEILFKKFGLDNIFSNEDCSVPATTTDCPWKIDVQKYLPKSLQDKVSCGMMDDCFGVNCCVDFEMKIPFFNKIIHKSVNVFVSFDPCEFQLKVGFGQAVHSEKLLDYQWDTQTTIQLGNGNPPPVTLTLTITKVDQGFNIDLSIIVCIPDDGSSFCFPEDGLNLLKDVHIPLCDARALGNLADSDFNLEEYLKGLKLEAGEKLKKSGAKYILNKLGITSYLLDERCDITRSPYSSSIDGWKNDCPKSLKPFPTLPKGLICHLDDTCTKIDCCFHVEFLDTSFHASLNLNMCDYVLEASIEKQEVKLPLLGDEYDLDKGITSRVQISNFLVVRFGVRKIHKKILIDLSIAACFQTDICQAEFDVFTGTEIPQIICDLNAKLDLKGFSVSDWAKEKGIDFTRGLPKKVVQVFLEQTGIAEKMLDPPCQRGSLKYQPALSSNWKNDCQSIKRLPELKAPVNCYIPDYCTGIDCCLESDLLGISLNAHLNIDTCNYVIEGSIEKITFKIAILDYDWGTDEVEQLSEFLYMKFRIDRLVDQKIFIVDLSLKMCFQGKANCEIDLPLLEQSQVPMPVCNMEMGFKLKDFSLKKWLEERGGDLTNILVNQLMDSLGITKYLKDTPCTLVHEPFKTASMNNGWNNMCQLNMTLPTLNDRMACYIPDYCTGIACCVDIREISRTFQAHLFIDTCNYIFSVGIENIMYNVTLVDYVWGTEETIDIGGIFKLKFRIEDLAGEKQYLVNLKMSACFTAGEECDLQIPVFTDVRVPKLLCDWDASRALKDFKLDEWIEDQGGQLTDTIIQKLLEQLGLSAYLLSPMCDKNSLSYSPAVQGWKKDCQLNMTLPTLPKDLSCQVPDFCTGIDCCLQVPFLKRSLRAAASIDMCTNVLTLSIEKVKLQKSLVNYKWGKSESFNLRGVVNIEYIIFDLAGDKQYLFSLNISICLSSDKPCQPSISVLNNVRVPKLFCDWAANNKLQDFSLKKFLEEQKQNLGDVLSELTLSRLFQALNISQYLVRPQCNRDSDIYLPANTKGWKYGCPIKTLEFGQLPDYATCRIPDFCTGIDCCITVPVIGRSFNVKVYLNACDYALTVSLENLVFKKTLLNYKWGAKEQFNINGIIGIEFVIDDLEGARQYLISVSVRFCFDSTTDCQKVPILNNARIPKILCDWESNHYQSDLSLSTWLEEQGMSVGNELSSIVLARFFNELNISQYLKDPQCGATAGVYTGAVNGWKNECSLIGNLPSLSNGLTCYIPDTCTGIQCCAPVPKLKRSFEAFMYLDPCNFKFRVGVEQYEFSRNLINYEWGTEESISLHKLVTAKFTIDDLNSEKNFMINLNISVCLENDKSCFLSLPVLINTKIPKITCDWDSTLALKGFSLSEWLEKHQATGVQRLTTALRYKLYENLEIASYIKSKPVSMSSSLFSPSNIKGWKNECPITKIEKHLPQLPDYFACHVGSRCTSVDCCIDVEFLNTSIYTLVDVNMCDYTLTLTIENLSYEQKLFDYKWGEADHFYLNGVIRIDFLITKVDQQKSLEISVNISVCLSETKCLIEKPILEKTLIPQPLCDFKKTLQENKFSLKTFKSKEKLAGLASPDVFLSKLLDETGLSDFLEHPACNRESSPYIPADSRNWRNECKKFTSPISLPDSARCHFSADCSTIDCCIYIGLIKRTFNIKFKVDICDLQVTLTLGKLSYNVSLFEYEWGKEGVFHISGRVRLHYNLVNMPVTNKIKTDLQIKVCFEEDSCLLEVPILKQVEISYSPCGITKRQPFKGITLDFWSFKPCELQPTPSGCPITLPDEISEICQLDDNCLGISCCIGVDIEYLGQYSLDASFKMDHCQNKLIYSLENKKWNKTLQPLVNNINITESIGEAIDFSFMLKDSGSSYVTSVDLNLCVFNKCKYWKLLDKKSLLKQNCNQRRKRRSIIKVKGDNYVRKIQQMVKIKASNVDIKKYLSKIKLEEERQRQQNLQPDWNDGGQANNPRSAIKTMGSTNPSTIIYTSKYQKFKIGIEGGEQILSILKAVTSVLDTSSPTYTVGKGLTGVGVQLLGLKLANMTIGEISALIDMKNIDPEKAVELAEELRDLVSALYSEILTAVVDGSISDIFKSFDFTLEADFSIPRKSMNLFGPISYGFLVGGFIYVDFEFGASCSFGMKIYLGAKVMKMIAYGGLVPYGAVTAYGQISIGFILYAGLRLEGDLMTTAFPTRAEIGFSKFPLEIGFTMDVEIIPLIVRLKAIVKLKINLLFTTIQKVLYQTELWRYKTDSIKKNLLSFNKKDADKSPPVFSQYTDSESVRKRRAAGLPMNTETRHCSVRQLKGRDYTEPAIEISVRAGDDKSQVKLFLTAGTKPGLDDALSEIQLGGPSSIITDKFKQHGLRIHFTVVGKNSEGTASTVTCSIPTYDISLPGGRFTAEFITSSNPRVLKASVVVFEDSDLAYAAVGVGFGRDIHGDEIEHWKPVDLAFKNEESYNADSDVHGDVAVSRFTTQKSGRLIAPVASQHKVNYYQACLKKCLELPASKCLSVNFDFGSSGNCELLESIEGHKHKISVSGKFVHMERLGIGFAYEFSYTDKQLQHNKLYYFNLDLQNHLGFRNIISSKGVLLDISPPVHGDGKMKNITSDVLEWIPCKEMMPSDQLDWRLLCIDQSKNVKNHRIIIDGVGSQTVFNGNTPLLDQRYFRANRFISANWDGIHDKETGIHGYTFAAGHDICEETFAEHRDPHAHFFSDSEWTHEGLIKREEGNPIPDGNYYVTVRALNKVEYGGPLVTSFCHSTKYTIDNTVPFVHEVFNVRYEEESRNLSAEYNASDPQSDVREVDICLGRSTKDCYIRDWERYPHSGEVIHNTELPGGIAVWVKIKAWNHVNMSALRSADSPLIIDVTPPIRGEVYDGPIYKHDLMYTKDSNKICANWVDFNDPESGLSYFSVFVRSSDNDMYLTNGTDFDHRTHEACIELENSLLEHSKRYYIELWAFNAGHKQLNVSGKSDGVIVDLTVPVEGEVVDGKRDNFVDIEFSSATATVSGQWKGQFDPESGIKSFAVQILRAKNASEDFEILRDWHEDESDTKSFEWHNFHLHHRDNVKFRLQTTNGALGKITQQTDGYVVDLTPPTLIYLNDGNQQRQDVDYQSSSTTLSANYKFVDEESGIDHYKYQIYQLYQGSKHQIYPEKGEWTEIRNPEEDSLEVTHLTLQNGAKYSVRVSAINRALSVATFDTNGFLLDNTPPKIRWVHAGVFNGETEEVIDGVVLQADKTGIKASWFATDDVSGIKDYFVAVGTTEGGQEILKWKSYGQNHDGYIDKLNLKVKNTYFVSVTAVNGAGLKSNVKSSTPIKVVEEDKAGIVFDGAEGTEGEIINDIDYQIETGTVTVQFSGFESSLHGISRFDWAVGTTAGGEEVQPFIEAGLIHKEETDVPGNGIAISGYGQAVLPLESGVKYYSTVRGISNAGNVLESTSDGFTVDTSPPIISIESLSEVFDREKLEPGMKIYQSEMDSIQAEWLVRDLESNISEMWYSVGSYPNGADIKSAARVSVFLDGQGSLPVGDAKPTYDGRPNIINFWAVNNVGLTGRKSSASLIVDITPPSGGVVMCPQFIQPHTVMKCFWKDFMDNESPIKEFMFSLGSQEGLSDVVQAVKIPGHSTSYIIDNLVNDASHGKKYYAMVTAKNYVGHTVSAVSNSITVDITPPVPGQVVELKTEYIINVTSDRSTSELNTYSCNTKEDCDKIDAVCQESLTSINVAWSEFTDPETRIVSHEIAIGTTPGGGQVKQFFKVPTDKKYFTIKNLMLNGLRQVFVTVKAKNEAGLGTVATSNGIYMSYLSQGKEPLSHIGVWDGDSHHGDIDYQTSIDTIKARWDVTGDPCPAKKFEWSIVRLDGLVVQNFTDTLGSTFGVNDGLSLSDGERYYILLRVTTASDFSYILRSNGVTVQLNPVIPGRVNDGDVFGYDLNKIVMVNKASANWQGFGVGVDDESQPVEIQSGNPGVDGTDRKALNAIRYYEVALGTDRRFPNTRDNVVPYTNVGLNTTVTFYDLELVTLKATYYFTVRAYSESMSMTQVTSNGFQAGYNDGVKAGIVEMPEYVSNNTVIGIPWNYFDSKVGMMMYYAAIASKNHSITCRDLIEGGKMSVGERSSLFDILDVTNVGTDTFLQYTNGVLKQDHGYFVTVIGVDNAGECNSTSFYFHVDITPPVKGQVKIGPYYNMKMSYTASSESLTVDWKNYRDDESGIKCFRLSLIEETTCETGATRTTIVPPIELNENYTSYQFLELDLQPSRPYIVKLEIENKAGLKIEIETKPVIYDTSTPTVGHVVDGTDYRHDAVWIRTSTTVTGSILYLPTPLGLPCPTQNIIFTDPEWKMFTRPKNYDSSGNRLQLEYRKANILFDSDKPSELQIKLARDVKTETMFSGGFYRNADMVSGGTYEVNIRAADGKAVTSIVLWDGPVLDIVDYDYIQEVDWTLCSCCRYNPNDTDCRSECDCESTITEEEKNVPENKDSASNSSSQADYVYDLTEKERLELVKGSSENQSDKPTREKSTHRHRACGIQILAGEAQKIVTWCRFKSKLNQPMKAERKLNFDPSKSINNYRLEFFVLNEEATERTWCLNVYVNNDAISEMCGIPRFSSETQFFLNVWNWKNFLPPLSSKMHDMFNVWSTKALFKDLIMPPDSNALCRYGNPFRGGTNAVVKFEAGIGRKENADDVYSFKEVVSPCVPCQTPCDRFDCVIFCNNNAITQHVIKLDNLSLEPTEKINGTDKPIAYYFTVKSVLGSGSEVISSSNGFYIDLTPPVFDEEVMLYIDVTQGNFTPVEYQGSNDTIRTIFLCQDNESSIVEYEWGIGTEPGALDIQDYISTGVTSTGTNRSLEGVLENNSTYYATVKCRNGAGLETVYQDQRGVTVLLYPPDITDVGTNITGAEKFSEDVVPTTAMKSTDPSYIGCSWTVSVDPSIKEYDFGIGSSANPCNDVFPFTWVGYNRSGEVAIKNGWLVIDGQSVSVIGAFNPKNNQSDASSGPSGYKMEPGRTLFLCMRMCNEARRCTVKNVGTSVLVDENSKMATSANGESVKVNLESSSRKKRSVSDLSIETPPGLKHGQSIVVTTLSKDDLEADYRSDASTEFISYISNPQITLNNNDNLHRLLRKRMSPRPSDKSYSITSIGNLPLPGPLIVTLKYNPVPTDPGTIPMLIHWNPVNKRWVPSKLTCGSKHGPDTVIVNETAGEMKIKVCHTWSSDEKVPSEEIEYFRRDTQFMVTNVLQTIPNTPPQLAPDVLRTFTMTEDKGTIVYDLKYIDEEYDQVEFSITDMSTQSVGSLSVTKKGSLLFFPCKDCFGNLEFKLKITEVTPYEIEPLVTEETLTITVKPENDAPSVFCIHGNANVLLSDPTEPVMMLMEQNRLGWNDTNRFIWTFGVYDVDKSDQLVLFIDKPKNGSLTVGPPQKETPHCDDQTMKSSLPCQGMSLSHPVRQMEWLYYKMTYEPVEGVSGYDDIRMFMTDDAGASSDVVTIRMAMMTMPCLNGGACRPISSKTTYTCENYRRAESFDDYYSCQCTEGWVGSRCQDDYDECTSSPCDWPYVCYNYENRYKCACSQDEPDCDGLFGWMIALIVIAVLLVVVICGMICYIWCVKKGRGKWSKATNRFNTSKRSDERPMVFDNSAYSLDNDEFSQTTSSNIERSEMVLFSKRQRYDGIMGPMKDNHFLPVPRLHNIVPMNPFDNSTGTSYTSSNVWSSTSDGVFKPSEVGFGPSTFDMDRRTSKAAPKLHASLIEDRRIEELQSSHMSPLEPYPDYVD